MKNAIFDVLLGTVCAISYLNHPSQCSSRGQHAGEDVPGVRTDTGSPQNSNQGGCMLEGHPGGITVTIMLRGEKSSACNIMKE